MKKCAEFWQIFLCDSLTLPQVSLQQEPPNWEDVFGLGLPFVSSCLENTAGLGLVRSHEKGQLIKTCCIFAI